MNKTQMILVIALLSFGLFVTQPDILMASTKGSPSKKQSSQSSGKEEVVIDGYCPVCLLDSDKLIKGKKYYTVEHKGKTYYFLGREQKEKFLKDPGKYASGLKKKYERAKNKKGKSTSKGSGYKGSH